MLTCVSVDMDETASAMPTRDRIILTALNLFSRKGYDSTSMNSIGSAVGMRGPSLYRHFESKEDILDAIVGFAEHHYMENMEKALGRLNPSTIGELIEITMNQMAFIIRDPSIRKIRRFFAMEQFRNERILEMATRHYIYDTRRVYTEIFADMIDKGILSRHDPDIMALQFTSPITLMIHMCDEHPEATEEVLEELRRHMVLFFSVYRTERDDGELR